MRRSAAPSVLTEDRANRCADRRKALRNEDLRPAISMKAYRVRGRFLMGRSWQSFSKEIAAVDEAGAREKLLSLLGSQHRVARRDIEIGETAEVPLTEIRDSAIRHALEGPA